MNSEILTALNWRYACKKFDANKKLTEEKLNILKEAFNLTATSYGLQPLKLLVVSNPKIKEQLVPMSMDQTQVSDASHVLIICAETEISSQYITQYFNKVEEVRNTPREILKSFEDFLVDSFSEKKKEDVALWTAKQAYIALGNLLTVCAMAGIDACPMEGFEPAKYNELFNLKEQGLTSVLVLPVGYRAEDDMFSSMAKVRRGIEKVVVEYK